MSIHVLAVRVMPLKALVLKYGIFNRSSGPRADNEAG